MNELDTIILFSLLLVLQCCQLRKVEICLIQTLLIPFAEVWIGTKSDDSHRGLPFAGQWWRYPCSGCNVVSAVMSWSNSFVLIM